MAGVKGRSGGPRPNSGRKSKFEELEVQSLALAAIKNVYGGLQEGFEALLREKEPSLRKFVFEHAAGKPKENVSVESGVTVTIKHES